MSIVAELYHTRLFPQSIGSGLMRGATRFVGAAMVMTAVAGWLALATWSNSDPSLSNATNEAVGNLLGYGGAVVADFLFQTLGLAAIGIFLPMAAWGWHLLALIVPNRKSERLLLWPFSLALLAGALASLVATKGWPLDVGLGGFVGDHVMRSVMSMGTFVELNPSISKILASMVLPVAGFWGLSTACGIKLSSYSVLLQREEKIKPHYDDSVIDYIAEAGAAQGPYGALETRVPVVGQVDHMGRIEPVVPHMETQNAAPEFIEQPQEVVVEQAVAAPAVQGQAAAAPVVAPAAAIMPVGNDNVVAMNAPVMNAPVMNASVQAPVQPVVQAPAAPASVDQVPAAPVFGYAPDADRQKGRTKTIRGEQLSLLDDPATGFTLPPLEFLKPAPQSQTSAMLSDEEIQKRSDLLEQVLEDFKVKGEVIDVKPGPVVTLYEFEPARGVKSAQVINLSDDIARIMGAVSARVAVIPGRNAIGIELPNEKREMVYLREQLEQIKAGKEKKARLPMVLGKNIGGDPISVDLAKMPHVLIAGTTGSGKSVGINTMIMSLLYNLTPDQCKFIMIDPKMLELSVYDGIPHLLSPVVTDPKKAVVALNWVVREMEERYKKMSQINVRNIGGYNTRIKEARAKGDVITRTVQTGFDSGTGQPIYEQEKLDYQELPFIVVVIDEMADLMMVAGKEIEGSVQRIAQKARAAGIHLITATQRPSVDVITGTIKANFPTRISFQVTSKIDSRTILGEMGAEALLGAGDMLHMAGGGQLSRVHGSFVSDEEVERVANYLKAQGVPQYVEDVTKDEEEEAAVKSSSKESAQEKFDSLYDEAVAVVLRDKKASTSYIQRRLSIGYNKAATLIERMQEEGVISAANHAGKREILIERDEADAI